MGMETIVDCSGPLAAGETWEDRTALAEAPPVPIEAARERLWASVKSHRAMLEAGGCDTPSGRVQTDPGSIAKINGLTTMAMIAQANASPFEIGFTLADNSIVALDPEDAIAMGLAVAGYVAAVYARSFELRAAIEAAENAEALAAIDIGEGWPE